MRPASPMPPLSVLHSARKWALPRRSFVTSASAESAPTRELSAFQSLTTNRGGNFCVVPIDLSGPGFSRLVEGEIEVIHLDLLLLGYLQQTQPDLLTIGRRTLACADARQVAKQKIGNVQVELATGPG